MNLKNYFSRLSADEKRDLAKTCDTSVEYLFQITGGHSQPSPKLALKIEAATSGDVTRHDLRPDVYPLAVA